MPITVNITVSGIQETGATIERVRQLTRDFTPLWDEIIDELTTSVGIVFQTDGFGQWARRQDDKGHPLLRETGKLQKSFMKGEAVIQKRPQQLIWGSRNPYHEMHEYGTRHIPARPILSTLATNAGVHERIKKRIENKFEQVIHQGI